MLTPNDIETWLQKPAVAQVILGFLGLMLVNEWISDVHIVYGVYQKMPTPTAEVPLNRTLVQDQSIIQKSLKIPLFGDYIPKTLIDLNVKASGLNMALVGVLFSHQPLQSQVLISIADGLAATYVVGDTLPGGVKIKQITPDGVLLEHAGELESLSLPKNELIFEPPPKPLLGE